MNLTDKPIPAIFKILLLYRLLLEGDKTKNEIIEIFNKENITLNKPTINRYISILKKNDVKINIFKNKNENVYSVLKSVSFLKLSKKEIINFKNIKKQLISKKNHNLIRQTMRLFYKIALHIEKTDTKKLLLDFGYFSKLNWALIIELEKHCKDKNIIKIEYITPDNKLKDITIHCDSVSLGKLSDRLYLNCVLENSNKISHLPVEKVFVIKKLIRRKVPLNLLTNVVTYVVSTNAFLEVEEDVNEKIIEKNEKYTTIEYITSDDFYLVQRLLYFCSNLYYISDENIKQKVLDKLNSIKVLYEKEQ